MKNLDVKHYLEIFSTRKKMQEKGITNQGEEIKEFISSFIEKLQRFPLNEEIILKDNSFFDSKDNLIIKIPNDTI